MTNLDDRHLLMIEPTQPPSMEPVDDLYTQKMRRLLDASTDGGRWYKGVHTCSCGETSTCHDHFLPGGIITNSLAVHYLERHRDEVPPSELAKLDALP